MLVAFNLIDSLANADDRTELLERIDQPSPNRVGSEQWVRYVDEVTFALYGAAATIQQHREIAIYLEVMARRQTPLRYLPAVLEQRLYVDSLSERRLDVVNQQHINHRVGAAGLADNSSRPRAPFDAEHSSSLKKSPDHNGDIEEKVDRAVESSGLKVRVSVSSRFHFLDDGETVEYCGESIKIESNVAMQLLKELVERNGDIVPRARFESKHSISERHVYGNAARYLKSKFGAIIKSKGGPNGGYYLADAP